MIRFVPCVLLTGLLLALGACSTPSSPTPSADVAGDGRDTAAPDGVAGDLPLPDAAVPDAALPDAALPDAALPDTGPADVPAPPPDAGPCPPNFPCDDGDPCTYGDRCSAERRCTGTAYQCSDGRDCTADRCDGLGDCIFELRPDHCLVYGVCAPTGGASPRNACLLCDAALDAFAWQPGDGPACDDGDPCTAGDHCRAGECLPGSEALPCDDGDLCTDDFCAPGVGCSFVENESWCDDGNPCTRDDRCLLGICSGLSGGCDDGNPCTLDYCEGGDECTHSPRPGPCDDGDACTLNDACSAGVCAGGFETPDCDDGNPCTYDICDALGGCLHANNTAFCNDNNPCTVNDRCREGICRPGEPLVCEDGNECTDETCDPAVGCRYSLNDNPCCENGHNICGDGDPCTTDLCDLDSGGCVYVFNTEACNDGDACTMDDRCGLGTCQGAPRTCDDQNPCTADSCNVQTGCSYQILTGPCDDHSACTVNDVCQFGACIGTLLNCADTNPCTADICDPQTGCQNPFNTDPCDDGDVCTVADQCRDGACRGNPDACDDGNGCTVDQCRPFVGCQHTQLPNGSSCEDGRECTVNEICTGGLCLGDSSACTCEPLVGPASKFTVLNIGLNGQTGEGLDVDGDPGTCFPPDNCCCGVDNSMSKFAALANPKIDEAIVGGDLFFLLQYSPAAYADGREFSLVPWPAKLVNEGCDFMATSCDYLVDGAGFDVDCTPLVTLPNARIQGTALTAGGVGYNFPFNLPLLEGIELQITLYNATIRGTVTLSGQEPTSVSGILAGAVPKQQILDAINAIPDADLPLPKNVIIQMVSSLVRDDIDTNDDGIADAASIGLKFTGISGRIVGVD